MKSVSRLSLATLLALAPHVADATNGMNMEGYGPIATAMGGAAFAYDNGTAALMNNPATLALLPDQARLDLALGILGPDITATAPNGASADSEATAFFMPAVGYVRRTGNLVYGLGMFGQGGMGCEYDGDSWRGLGFGLKNRTEVSVGRVIAPIAYSVNERLHLAATVDFVWAGMDLQMAMSGPQFMDLVMPNSQQAGRASGGIVQGFGQIMQQMPPGTSVDYAYFDFANSSDFTGEASGTGYAGKIGLVYEATPNLKLALTYHTETRLSDLSAPGNAIRFQLNVPGMGAMPQTLNGDITVRDFEWPSMLGGGLAWRPADGWLLVADLRHVAWSDVMENFTLRFIASSEAANGPFAGQDLNAVLYQKWSDQTVLQLGAAYELTPRVTLRGGFNTGDNPVPDPYLNCLFPATVETHVTVGLGWRITTRSSLDVSFVYGFESKDTNAGGITVEHAQRNLQVMYSVRF